jgi:hypothetical protein
MKSIIFVSLLYIFSTSDLDKLLENLCLAPSAYIGWRSYLVDVEQGEGDFCAALSHCNVRTFEFWRESCMSRGKLLLESLLSDMYKLSLSTILTR